MARTAQRIRATLSWRLSEYSDAKTKLNNLNNLTNTWMLVTAAVGSLLIGLLLAALAQLDFAVVFVFPALLVIILLIGFRQYIALTGVVVCIAILVDFYEIFGLPLHEPVVAITLASLLIAIIFFFQSAERPWISLRHLQVWALLLALTGLAVVRGGSLVATVPYFVTIIVTSIVMYCLGTQVIRTYRGLYTLNNTLMIIATFIAVHTIVQAATGRFLLVTQRETNYLSSVYGFNLANSSVTRAGSFLLNPDWNGIFLAMMLFVAVGALVTDASSRYMRLAAGIAVLLIVIALLFTFTTASWLSAVVAAALFVCVFVPRRYRWWTVGAIVGLALLIGAGFNRQARLLVAHAMSGNDVKVRFGAWETALRIILHYPLTGIGMGYKLYFARSEVYRVPLQTQPLVQPHNSYLELAAFAGLPVLLAFVALLALMFHDAIHTYRVTDPRYQPLVGGAITALVALTVNSFFIDGWTLAPFACLGWLLFGAITSRALLPPRAGCRTPTRLH